MISRFVKVREYLQLRLDQMTTENIVRQMSKRCDIAAEYLLGRSANAALENISQSDGVLDAIEAHFVDGKSLVLLGPSGTGKTYIQTGMIREHVFHGHSVMLVSAPDIAHTDLDELTSPSGLLIDDLGVESDTPKMYEKMFQLFDRRWDCGKATVISSNLDLEAFIERVGDRVFDRIDGPTVVLSGPSRRGLPVQKPEPFRYEGRGLKNGAFIEVALSALDLPDDDLRRWYRLLVDEGLFEMIVGDDEYFPEPWQAAPFVAAVHEVFGHKFDEWMLTAPGKPIEDW
jgi:IstB-like ATP binding protein